MEGIATTKHSFFNVAPEIQNFIKIVNKYNKCWSHIAPFSRLYLVKLKVVGQRKSQQ